MSRAAIYIRVSTMAQADHGTSLDSQLESCRSFADTLGDDVTHVCQDMDSGADETIPGFLELVDLCAARAVDRVIIDHPDRLSRSLLKKVMFRAQLAKTGVDVRYVHLPIEDTAEGRLTENMFAALAEYERERIAFRNARGRRAKASRGEVVGNGWAPFGYDFERNSDGRVVGLVPNEHALIVRTIFELVPTTSAAQIAAKLNAEGVPTMFGGSWADSTILGMLANPAYRGVWAYGRRDTHKHPTDPSGWIMVPCPAIIDEPMWKAAQAARAARRTERASRLADDPYLLRRRLTCGYCGRTLACVPNNARRRYQCLNHDRHTAAARGVARCPLPQIPAPELEAHLWERMQTTVLDPLWIHSTYIDEAKTAHRDANAGAQQLRSLERQIERQRSQLDAAMERVVTLPQGERLRSAERAAAKLEATITDLQDKIDALRKAIVETVPERAALTAEDIAHALATEIGAYTVDEQREAIEALAITGTVRDDPDGEKLARGHRWQIHWRTGPVVLNVTPEFKKTRVSFYTGVYEVWEQKYMPEAVKAG